MSITEQVHKAVQCDSTKMAENTDFTKLRDFYAEMQRLGIATKQEYSLPPLDTVGRRVHQLTQAKMFKG